jgi:hypothetical protein
MNRMHPNSVVNSMVILKRIVPEGRHIFSPWIVATTFRECLLARNSKYQIPCHVPVASLPFEMGTVTLAPMSADLICA